MIIRAPFPRPVQPADAVCEILATLRRPGGEPTRIEAKRALGGLPRSVRETLSSFSNTDGGILLLGVDEQNDFEVVELEIQPRYKTV